MRPPRPRWPLDPLVDAGHVENLSVFAAVVGITPSGVSHARRRGLSTGVAARWAARLDVDPAAVWPDWPQAVTE